MWDTGRGRSEAGGFLKNVCGFLKPTFFIPYERNQQPRGFRNGVRKERGDEGSQGGHGPHSCGFSITHLDTRT